MSRYLAEDDGSGGKVKREYHNVFLLRFDADGRCAEFTEQFQLRPA